ANYAFYNGAPYYPSGRWQTGGYNCLNLASTTSGTFGLRNPPNDPTSPLVQGVTGITTSSRVSTSLNAARGASAVWSWTDGLPAVCTMLYNGHRRVDLNWYPVLTS